MQADNSPDNKKQSPFTLYQEFSFSISKNEFVKKLYDHIPPNDIQEKRSKLALDTSRGYCWAGATKDNIKVRLNASAQGIAKIDLGFRGDQSSISLFLRVSPPFIYILLFIFLILFFGVFLVVGYLTKKPGMVAGALAVVIPMFIVLVLGIRKGMKLAKENFTNEIYNVVKNV